MAIFAKTLLNRNIVGFFCLLVCLFYSLQKAQLSYFPLNSISRSRRLEWQQDAGQCMLSIRAKGMLCAWTVSYAVLCLLEQWCMIIGYTAWRKQYYIYLCIYQKVYIIFGDVDFTPRLYSLYLFLSGRLQTVLHESISFGCIICWFHLIILKYLCCYLNISEVVEILVFQWAAQEWDINQYE